MSKSRSYSRKELESLRRADLQNLFKIHGLKGANQRSDHLVDGLIAFFGSAAFRPASPAQGRQLRHADGGVNRGGAEKPPGVAAGAGATTRLIAPMKRRPGAAAPAVTMVGPGSAAAASGRPLASQVSGLRKQARPVLARKDSSEARMSESIATASNDDGEVTPTQTTMSPSAPRDTPLKVTEGLSGRLQTLSDRMDSLVSREAGPSTMITRSEFKSLQTEVQRLREKADEVGHVRTSGRIEQDTLLEERDARWRTELDQLELKWKTRLEAVTADFASRFQELESRLAAMTHNSGEDARPLTTPAEPSSTINITKQTANTLGKRRERDGAGVRETSTQSLSADSPAKRLRTIEAEADSALINGSSSSPKTPSPPNAVAFKTPEIATHGRLQHLDDIEPHTPSPTHRGLGLPVPLDGARTPVVVQDHLAGPPGWPSQTAAGLGIGAPPMFATTPKPQEPRSPTLDVPPSANRIRIAQRPMPSMLTPGRRRADADKSATAPRAVSQAHMELSTITESAEMGPGLPIRARLASRGYSPPAPLNLAAGLLGPTRAMSARPGTASPPKLSPSPSIMETRFNPLPFPRSGSSQSQAHSHGQSQAGALGPADSSDAVVSTPATSSSQARPPSPDQEANTVSVPQSLPDQSPSALATPKHRTLLGTERYMDTRFQDELIPMWDSPTALGDYGLGSTPRPPARDQ